ncbi:MAG: ROK family protein [Oscillospiraceae bacterium]|nr:ROK family protein [Oscillospiraceae bacterium]
MHYIGIDLGGTNVAAGLVDKEGKLLGEASIPTPQGAGAVADAIVQAAQKVAENAGIAMTEVESVGLAVPGTFDPKMGLVYRAVNLGLENVPLGSMVGQRLDLPVVLENDANAAALGEFVAGAGRGHSSLVAVTLGTGVGAGAILDGKLYVGFNYAALEAGHMVIRRGGRQCNCGRKGCWEAYASATGLIASTKEAMARHPESALWEMAPSFDKVTGKTPFDAAQAGDRVAKNVVDEYVEDLACGLINLINILQPEIITVSGGVSKQGEALLAPVQAILDREEMTRSTANRTQIQVAQLGSEAGTIGAALVPLYR